jgi:hypothetical protein
MSWHFAPPRRHSLGKASGAGILLCRYCSPGNAALVQELHCAVWRPASQHRSIAASQHRGPLLSTNSLPPSLPPYLPPYLPTSLPTSLVQYSTILVYSTVRLYGSVRRSPHPPYISLQCWSPHPPNNYTCLPIPACLSLATYLPTCLPTDRLHCGLPCHDIYCRYG